MSEQALVSIIIPTYKRLDALREAVGSALAQSYPNIEVIVVSDGPDDEVRAAMQNIDSRLHYVELPVNQGPAEARNRGVSASCGEWLTFLDDDDTMLPEKVEHQVRLADAQRPQTMVSCRTIYRHDGQDDIWPSRPLAPDEDIGDYIFVRPSFLGRPGVLPVQSLLVHRSLMEKVPFTTHSDHEDWAWLLEVWHRVGARIDFVWEPLVVYNIVTASISRSRRMNWRDSLQWAARYQAWLSKPAYNSFLSTKVALKARRAGDWKGLREIAGLVMRNHPRPMDLFFLFGITLLPGFVLHQAWKRSLSAAGSKTKLRSTSEAA